MVILLWVVRFHYYISLAAHTHILYKHSRIDISMKKHIIIQIQYTLCISLTLIHNKNAMLAVFFSRFHQTENKKKKYKKIKFKNLFSVFFSLCRSTFLLIMEQNPFMPYVHCSLLLDFEYVL